MKEQHFWVRFFLLNCCHVSSVTYFAVLLQINTNLQSKIFLHFCQRRQIWKMIFITGASIYSTGYTSNEEERFLERKLFWRFLFPLPRLKLSLRLCLLASLESRAFNPTTIQAVLRKFDFCPKSEHMVGNGKCNGKTSNGLLLVRIISDYRVVGNLEIWSCRSQWCLQVAKEDQDYWWFKSWSWWYWLWRMTMSKMVMIKRLIRVKRRLSWVQ